MQDKTWIKKSLCSGHPDPDLWHYENSNYHDVQQLQVLRSVEAIEICMECPVKQQCLQQGLEEENVLSLGGFGTIWGGLMTSERMKLLGLRETRNSLRHEGRHRREVRAKLARIPR
jgi:hypothetical protein